VEEKCGLTSVVSPRFCHILLKRAFEERRRRRGGGEKRGNNAAHCLETTRD